MSMEHAEQVVCPKCEREQTVVIWDSLNADITPEAKEALFNGEINAFVCEGCGEHIMISIPLLYHDMKRQFTVQYFPFDAVKDVGFIKRFGTDGIDKQAEETFAEMPAAIKDSAGYMRHPHTVFSMAELVRYIIFRERIFEVRGENGGADGARTRDLRRDRPAF